jgi:hypothetical protein
MALVNPITYTRGTTYNITHNYTALTYLGTYLIFTVKKVQNDSDITDTTNQILAPKIIPINGTTFPQTTTISINPGDIPVTVGPGNYYYSIKVFDSAGGQYITQSGSFVLKASTTNEITS